MKMNKKRLVQIGISGLGTLLGMVVAACIKEKSDEYAPETEAVDVDFEEVPAEEVGAEEVTEE